MSYEVFESASLSQAKIQLSSPERIMQLKGGLQQEESAPECIPFVDSCILPIFLVMHSV